MSKSHQKVKPKKHLGQHFLNDEGIAERIARSIASKSQAKKIVEIGPGTGALTKHLIPIFGPKILALEIDAESIRFLEQEEWIGHEQILEADFLKLDFQDLNIDGNLVITGNFPYNISSQILFQLLDWRANCIELTGMFQKEVAERVCAPHGSKTYGILSVLIQNYFDAEYLFTVPPHVFTPPPKVQSGVMRLLRKTDINLPVEYGHLKRVVKAAFNQRRKTLRNALKSGGLNIDGVDSHFLTLRAEQVSPSEFLSLAASVPLHS